MNAPWLMATYVMLTLLVAPNSFAQNTGAQRSTASEEADGEKAQQAKSLIKEARAARKKGDLNRTAALLLRAYSIDSKPVLLNNLGKVYEEMGRYDLAYATYKRVVDDPNTSQKLRDLDKDRMARIYEKLTATLVQVPNSVTWSQVWINSKGYPMGSGIELSVPTGPLMIDIFDAKSTVVVRLDVNGPAGRRLVLDHNLTKNLDQRFGVMSWDRANRKLKGMSIDDVAVSASLVRAKGVQIAPGRYRVGLEWVGETRTFVDVEVKAGMLIELKPNVDKPKAAIAPMPSQPTQAPIPTEQPPSLNAQRSAPTPWLLLTSQVAVAAAGLVVVGWGYADYSTGQSDRDTLRGEQADIDTNRPGSIALYRQWESKNDEATAQVNQGLVKMSLGGVAAIGAVIWIFATDTAPNQTTLSFDGHQKLSIGGTF